MYIPHTAEQTKEMLGTIGVNSIEELFSDIPEKVKINGELNLPSFLSEPELLKYFINLTEMNEDFLHNSSFLGGGAYYHYIPSVVSHLVFRSEFYTAYTPYQPEISQGILQAIFEYQTLICQLTGMDVSNASHYNGATAVAEAAMMAVGHTRRKKVLVSPLLHPDYRQTLKTYFSGREESIEELPFTGGKTDLSSIEISKDVAAVIVQNPNFLGHIEDFSIAEKVHKGGALFIVAVTEPFSMGIIKSPGETGADIVAGEGHVFGNPIAFGGPHLGFLACKEPLMRKMAGRLVGKTTDHDGKPGFVLTLQTREQHIRRERATSNICSNQALCALAATVYLSYAGKQGFCEVSNQSFQKAHYGYKKIKELPGYDIPYSIPFFNEFIVTCPKNPVEINEFLLKHKIIGGYAVEKHYPELKNSMLLCFTEMNSRESIDKLVELLGEVK